MSERPIQVGDWVVLAKPCPKCRSTLQLGLVFKVQWAGNSRGNGSNCCGADAYVLPIANDEPNPYAGFAQHRLIRLKPDAELETERTEEKLREPA